MLTLTFTLLLLAALAAAAGFLARLAVWWYSHQTGFRVMPDRGSGVAAYDTGAAPAVLLRDPTLGLCGRPDYLLIERTGDDQQLLPLELKPRRRSRRLYDSDAVQLGAYLVALRATYGSQAAPYGYVRYAADTFRVELNPALEAWVRGVVRAIRADRGATVVHRSHSVPTRCAGCAVRDHCDERLV